MSTLNLPYGESSHHRPRFNYQSPAAAGGSRPQRPEHETSQLPLPQSLTTARHQKQRRISRSQHGLRVSRRLPARTSRGSLPTADSQSPLSQDPQSPESPYWGTLQSPSSTCKSLKAGRIADNRTVGKLSNEVGNSGPAKDKALPKIEPTDPKRQERKTPRREKRFGVADPLAWDILNRSLSQQHRLSSLIGIDGSVSMTAKQSPKKTVDAVSRTSSQRRALNRFTKELEKYADAAGAVGAASTVNRIPVATPTISESKVSMHTVKPLVPYKDEFLSAGLAVTSTEQNQNGKAHIHASLQNNRPHKHSNGPLQSRKRPDPASNSTSSSASASTPYTGSESYVEFSPPDGHMLHAMETLVPRRTNTKPRHCQYTRKRLLSWFLKKPSIKDGSNNGHQLPVQIQYVKGGQIKSNDLSTAQHGHHQLQHRSHKPTMQSIPEIQLLPKRALPGKYVTPKKEPYVAIINDSCEQRDQGLHPEQEDGHNCSVVDAKQYLDKFGLRDKRYITRGVLPKPSPEPIETIDEETEISTHLVGNNVQNPRLTGIDQKELPIITEAIRQRPDGVSLVAHESSIPRLPFAAQLAAGTSSSLQRALDDACQKLDSEEQKVENGLKRENTKPEEPPPVPRQDPRHSASRRALPPKPRSTEKYLYGKRKMPPVEVPSLISKPLPPEPAPEKRPDAGPSQPNREPPPVPRALTGKRKNAVAELAKAEEMLKDLDVFLNDYDDADIEDRDVIKGLQVAIHAAADDLYDGYIRHKTGLRIRRFLADLKSFENISELTSADRRAREKRAEGRRLVGVRDRNSRR